MWWRPHRRDWWMAVLFVIGALCFTVGGIASQWITTARSWIGVTFLVGSLFFTSAAYCSMPIRQRGTPARTQDASPALAPRHRGSPSGSTVWRPSSRSSAPSCLDICTFAALHQGPDHQADQCARVGAGRVRLDRVPDRERAGDSRRSVIAGSGSATGRSRGRSSPNMLGRSLRRIRDRSLAGLTRTRSPRSGRRTAAGRAPVLA